LDGNQHRQRALCPIPPHGNLERQRNDRLGRSSHQRFEYGRQILRTIRSYTYADPHGDSESDSNRNAYSNSVTYSYCNAYPMYGEVFTDAEASAYSAAAPIAFIAEADPSPDIISLANPCFQNAASQKTFTLRLFFSRNLRGNC
jgi:hypothetical protein